MSMLFKNAAAVLSADLCTFSIAIFPLPSQISKVTERQRERERERERERDRDRDRDRDRHVDNS